MTQPLWFFGSRFNIIADHTTTDGKYDIIEGYFPPSIQTPPHLHTRYSEQLYVLKGEFTVWAGDSAKPTLCERKVVLNTGESFLIAPGTPHVVASLSQKAARGLVIAAPSSFARLIAAVGTLDETALPDMELFDRICAEIGDKVLGPLGALPLAYALAT
jgi:mannose-6-phosphate isomerase-like protein (cupin superfamily)